MPWRQKCGFLFGISDSPSRKSSDYGIPEGRLCASHCQIIDPLKGVVVTDFNCPRGELRCLVPWRPWAKKNKTRWEREKTPGRWSWDREFYEMIPNWALEKHAWLGAGLIWKRTHASNTTNRQDEEEAERQRGKRRTPAVKDSGPSCLSRPFL